MSKAVYAGVDGIARKVKKMYIGVPTSVGMSRNLLKQRQFGSLVHNGISFVQQADGGIRVSGNASADALCNLSFIADATTVTFSYPAGTLTASVSEKTSALAITVQPEDATVCVGLEAVFSVKATGEGLSYQWKYRYSANASWVDSGKDGAKTDTLRFIAENYHNGYEYCCVITDASGQSITSDPATLTVKEATDTLEIISQPKSVELSVGETAQFTVVACGEELSYRWYILKPDSEEWAVTTMPGNRTETLSVEVLESRDGYKYRCIVTNAIGQNVISDAATLTVKEETIMLAIGGWDENGATVSKGTVSEGGNLTFEGNGELARIYLTVSSGAAVDTVVYPQLELGSEATDYVPYGEVYKSIARKVKKAYIGVGGVARQFYSADFLTYDGEYEVIQVEYEGKICDLYRLKKSGILTLNDDALFWMCGGGGVGRAGFLVGSYDQTNASHNYSMWHGGGGGAGAYAVSGELEKGVFSIVVAAGDTNGSAPKSQILSEGSAVFTAGGGKLGTYAYSGGIGGTGGGGAGWRPGDKYIDYGAGGSGDGISKYPFGLTDLKAHCAGGGAGGYAQVSTADSAIGGAGGSNGRSGGTAKDNNTMDSLSASAGGTYGGGKGAGFADSLYNSSTGTVIEATAGSFYGAGGGGGLMINGSDSYNDRLSNGRAGYQGVVYILDVNGGVPA